MLVRLVLLALLASLAPAQQKPTTLFQEVDEMTSSLSEITGWPVKRKVPAKIITKEEFRHQVESRMKGASTNKEVHAEEMTLKMFGFMPQDFDLAKETVDLVSEQAAAFYDYSTRNACSCSIRPSEGTEQRVALVHELAHALADQQHPLGKYLNKGFARRRCVHRARSRDGGSGDVAHVGLCFEAQRRQGRGSERMIEKLTDRLRAPRAPIFRCSQRRLSICGNRWCFLTTKG